MEKVPSAGENYLFQALREKIVHGVKRLQTSGTVFSPVHRQRGHRRRRGADAILQRAQGRVAIVGMERMPVIIQRCGDHAGLTKGGFEAFHHVRWRVKFG